MCFWCITVESVSFEQHDKIKITDFVEYVSCGLCGRIPDIEIFSIFFVFFFCENNTSMVLVVL